MREIEVWYLCELIRIARQIAMRVTPGLALRMGYAERMMHGRFPWKTLFQPAIELAKKGFEVSPTLGDFIAKDAKKILDDPGLRKLYAPEGTLLKEGDVCKNEELGRTLEVVAEQGPQAFYNGTIAEKLVKDIKEAGGILTMEDLRNYKVEIADAMTLNVMGYTIYGMPPPSSGTLALSLVCTFLSPLFCHVAL
ncbi:hypothetical protein VIGAN_06038500 [Vigna angularis var. angularis]|uniref:Gamma-glutamyltranspeptidase n=1 Tax=Vigna angularis var. angularis TaxID=157739 RepID=A0A0S3S9I4_PHAAN|nr:hypothetical protein VIGAN_06038500 [Vigna angularis var. angularis]